MDKGFLLTRKAHQSADVLQITLWIKTSSGPVKLLIDNELALFFIEQVHLNKALKILAENKISLQKYQTLQLKTFNHQTVSALYFSNLTNFYSARDVLIKNEIKCYEDDIRPDDRFLMERHITADLEFKGITSEQANMPTSECFKLINHGQCKRSLVTSDIQLTMLSLDIECSANEELYSIALYASNIVNNNSHVYKKVLIIGSPEDQCENYIEWVSDEQQLLSQFIKAVLLFDPDILIGWNVINFDFFLLQKRCDLYNIRLAIGRDGTTPFWRKNKSNSDQVFIEISGRVVLDGIDLLKTATYKFSSFSLDNVAKSLLGLSKKIANVENRVKEITDNFNYNKPALAAYNLEDCRLVWFIFDKAQLLSFAKLRSQLTGLPLGRVGGSVAAFTNLYLPKLHRAGYIAPSIGDQKSGLISPGGYVMNSMPGLYRNVLVLDFKSLYPSIIRTFKIDPMGLVEGLMKYNASTEVKNITRTEVITGYDGAYFSRKHHFLPDIIESLWLERDKAKGQANKSLSQAIKILMNSFYGVLGSSGCRFFDPHLSGSITKRGHDILKTTRTWINQAGYQVIYGDTDSLFVCIGNDVSHTDAQRQGYSLQNLINAGWRNKLKQDFNIVSHLEIEFETHFSTFLMPKIRGNTYSALDQNIGTKKRYAGMVDNNIIFKGLEVVRSDWTALSKEFQQEIYRLVFNNLPVNNYITGIVRDIKLGIYDEKLIYKKTIRRNLADYTNTPPHIKAALIANSIMVSQGNIPKYKQRVTIEYVVTLDGVQPYEFNTSKLDYDFYINKQLKPIADDILPFISQDFSAITDDQLDLF